MEGVPLLRGSCDCLYLSLCVCVSVSVLCVYVCPPTFAADVLLHMDLCEHSVNYLPFSKLFQ